MFGRGRAAPARSPADEDARALALEVGGVRPERLLDPMTLGLVLEPGEKAYRATELLLSHLRGAGWSDPVLCPVVVTDVRLIVRMPLGRLESLWWRSLVGFVPDLQHGRLVLDYGDGCPRHLSGPGISAAVVVGIATLYGREALTTHAALAGLRDPVVR